MTMHLLPPMFSTTGKKKGKAKFRNADSANKARRNAEAWQELMAKWDIKSEPTKKDRRNIQSQSKFNPVVNSRVVVDPSRSTHGIPSVVTGQGIAAKKPTQQYTGDAMIGIGQLHKSNGIPVFSKEEAHDLALMRRG